MGLRVPPKWAATSLVLLNGVQPAQAQPEAPRGVAEPVVPRPPAELPEPRGVVPSAAPGLGEAGGVLDDEPVEQGAVVDPAEPLDHPHCAGGAEERPLRATQDLDTLDVELLEPILDRHDVQLVLAGHDHNYQRHEKNGVVYIVTGGGGAPLASAHADACSGHCGRRHLPRATHPDRRRWPAGGA